MKVGTGKIASFAQINSRKAASSQSTSSKPAGSKSASTKSTSSKPTVTQSGSSKSTSSKSSKSQSTNIKSTSSNPVSSKSTSIKSTNSILTKSRSASSKSTDTTPINAKKITSEPLNNISSGSRPINNLNQLIPSQTRIISGTNSTSSIQNHLETRSNPSTSIVKSTVQILTNNKNHIIGKPINSEIHEGVIYENSRLDTIYGLYTSRGVLANTSLDGYKAQQALTSLSFYNGPTDGNLSSDKSKKAVKNFQQVYGLKVTGKMDKKTKSKLSAAYSMKSKCTNDPDLKKLQKKLQLNYEQKDTMLNVWAFLRVGMGLSTKQASGICGNIYNESAFSSDNAENTSYPGIHNPE